MYQLVSKVQDGLTELKSLLERHIINQGESAISKCGEAALNVRCYARVSFFSALVVCYLGVTEEPAQASRGGLVASVPSCEVTDPVSILGVVTFREAA